MGRVRPELAEAGGLFFLGGDLAKRWTFLLEGFSRRCGDQELARKMRLGGEANEFIDDPCAGSVR